MGASDPPDTTGASDLRTAAGNSPADATREYGPAIATGSWEQLQAAFARAATVADRAVGLWLAKDATGSVGSYHAAGTGDTPDNEMSVHRALARAAATAYARRVKADGLPPEQMLVLVKSATSMH